ncbi:uncharacterized protein LOC125648408 [Ostrea edulis]|uniref:uncharacterized protein LOC125648408 n=1 Tax=Ostrea edulis TaxID=37623 RepID=UPI0024AEE26D|nr:uncharacterized protein LOC125648408 [Ostrea edulis]
MVRGVLANTHQGCQIFAPFNGVQCTAVALIALLTFMTCFRSPRFDFTSDFSSVQLDQMLNDGTKLYATISQEFQSLQYLGHNQMPKVLNYQDNDFTLEYFLDYYYGIVDTGTVTVSQNDEFGQMNLYDALSQAMLISSNFLLTLNDLTIALHADISNNRFLVFDSHQRNQFGFQDADNGAAVLLSFESFEELHHYICASYSSFNYELTPVTRVEISNQVNNSTNVDPNQRDGQHKCVCNDHSYVSKSNCKKRARQKRKRCYVENRNASETIESDVNRPVDYMVYEIDMLDVCEQCNVSTDSSVEYVDYLELPFHVHEYEESIRESPDKCCSCCFRILFKDQTFLMSEVNDACKSIDLNVSSDLCSTCKTTLKQNKIPSISLKGNNLDTGLVPRELEGLTLLEKKMLSKINVFMTLIFLPGGQYAQKGLVLNLPVNIENIIEQFPQNLEQCPLIELKFENSNGSLYVGNHHKIRSKKYAEAMHWLIKNNCYYTDLSFNVSDVVNDLNKLNENFSTYNKEEEELEEAVMIPVDNSCNISKHAYIHVQRSKSEPVNILLTEHGEELAFPWLFVNEKNGFGAERPLKINPSMYFKVRLYNEKGHFRKNMTYLLHTAASYNISLLKQELGIHMKILKTVHSGDQSFVTAGDVKNMNENSDLLENSYMFMKNIKGTVAYFRNVLYDLLAIFKSLGPPTLFVTLSADDLHWPELGMTLQNINFKDAFGKSFFQSMRKDPLLAATHFDRRFRALLKHVILGKTKPLGTVLDYFARIEFQNRGSPHVHMFLWIDGLPAELNHNTSSEFIHYIDRTISSNVPDVEQDYELNLLVKKLQTHHHSSYCSRGYRLNCRFGFPRKIVSTTRILPNIDLLSKSKTKFYETKRNQESTFINDLTFLKILCLYIICIHFGECNEELLPFHFV